MRGFIFDVDTGRLRKVKVKVKEGNMDHNEAVRKFEHLMLKAADQAHEVATELEGLALILRDEKPRQLAQIQAKASHKQAKDFRELAQRVKEK